MKKEVRLFNDNFNIKLTDTPYLRFLDYIEEDVEVNANTTEINGTDGVLMGPTTFDPFNLVLNFSFRGLDTKDLILQKQKLRNILFRREPYYIWHSDAPGKKYLVYCDSNENEDLTHSFATFKVTFVVVKGYSESLKDTSQFSLSSGDWQFEGGVLADDEIKYKHDTTSFKIFNGSSDTIAPFPHRHKLIIKLNVNAPKGFKLINRTTGDVFEYKKTITKSKQIIINGIYPTIDGKRVGIDTNHEWLKLTPGYNDIEIIGTDITEPTAEFIFPFIYR